MIESIVLLTSTIQPKVDQPQLVLSNPLERLEDYRKALVFYSNLLNENIIQKIVFVDNSNYDLKGLMDEFSNPAIEFISFYGLDYSSSYHRGYGEFKLVDYAFEYASYLKNCDSSAVIWKVSGRYIVKNFKTVIKFTPKSFDLYLDTRKNWVEMSVMAWSKVGYHKVINNVCEEFKTGMAPELILAKKFKLAISNGAKIVNPFIWPTYLIARRGTDGKYFENRFTPIKFLIKAVVLFIIWPVRYFLGKMN